MTFKISFYLNYLCIQIHYSKQGQAFRAQAQSLHIETLKSPWLSELLALYINLRQTDPKVKAIAGIFGDCSLTFDDDKPMLSCGLFDSVKLNIDLTCSICLVSFLFWILACASLFILSCGMIFFPKHLDNFRYPIQIRHKLMSILLILEPLHFLNYCGFVLT